MLRRRLARTVSIFLPVIAVGYAWGCARQGRPTGGPQDRIPPMVVSTWPDTFATVEPTRDPIVITFSERISERPTVGRLDDVVVVSPETGQARVKHTRSGLEISLAGGLRPGLVYRVRVLNTVKDMFNNPMEGPFELVFSTGGAYELNVLAGVVTDRITGEKVDQARKVILEEMLAHAPDSEVLRNLAREYGADPDRFEKESAFCILCGLCVRYCAEIKHKNAVGFNDRGPRREISFIPEVASKECWQCKECFPLCPTSYAQAAYVLAEALAGRPRD